MTSRREVSILLAFQGYSHILRFPSIASELQKMIFLLKGLPLINSHGFGEPCPSQEPENIKQGIFVQLKARAEKIGVMPFLKAKGVLLATVLMYHAQAKDIKGKGALAIFLDPQLLKGLRIFDCELLELVRHIVCVCVAKAISKDRPTIDMVFPVLDKAWRSMFCNHALMIYITL
ncbi:hypothetical protein Sjap_008409 [Stephania japonica]|uniref:Uncharacterized protein n=1 Tax=Stephania japonica TaxID=461633 RepID=A0AAP0PEK7_9MAGN